MIVTKLINEMLPQTSRFIAEFLIDWEVWECGPREGPYAPLGTTEKGLKIAILRIKTLRALTIICEKTKKV
jgi:hypothetical protein